MKIRNLLFLLILVLSVLIVSNCASRHRRLRKSAENGNFDEVKRLIDEGVKIDTKDYLENTALMLASEKGHTEIVYLLLKAGAYVDARDSVGQTSLMAAAKNGHYAIARLLIDAGADVNAHDRYCHAVLSYAKTERIAELLEEAGARGPGCKD